LPMGKKITTGTAGSPDSKMFSEMFLLEANMLVKLHNPERIFSIDTHNREVIRSLCAYFTGQKANGLNPSKGILLSGPVGVGKSLLLKAFSNTLKRFNRAYKFVACQDVVLEYENTGQIAMYMGNEGGYSGKPAKVCFDELGRETIPALHYGNRRNVIQHILAYRYNQWQNQGLITHATTNASPRELVTLYGEHIADRIREMFNLITLQGESRR